MLELDEWFENPDVRIFRISSFPGEIHSQPRISVGDLVGGRTAPVEYLCAHPAHATPCQGQELKVETLHTRALSDPTG